MQQILKFFIQYKIGILFLVLFSIAIALTIQSHSYHNNKWIASTNSISSFFLDVRYNITSYFNLEVENENLQLENKQIKQQLYNFKSKTKDSIAVDSLYIIKTCHIISNIYDKKDNFILIDVGQKDGVYEGFAVTIPNGVLGIVEKSTQHYSRVISILNTNLSINAKLKKTNEFGSLRWDTQNPNKMLLEDLPRSASFKIGDTIVTGSNSLIFPKEIPIGLIENYELNYNAGYYNIEVKLFADMTNLNQAYVIIPNKIKEAKKLLENDESI